MASKNTGRKLNLHPRNKNLERYDLCALIKATPELQDHIVPNKLGEDSVNFSSAKAVKLLNKAILNHYYGVTYWEFPDENLCPPIPGRADYIHHLADVLTESNFGQVPDGNQIKGLDIGTGASCIYPLIGASEYGWKFVASDIDPISIQSAQRIIKSNSSFDKQIECRIQSNKQNIFDGIISKDEKFDLTMCNPPFHASMDAAMEGSLRKIKNLTGKRLKSPELNFAGNLNELVCEGGEFQFIAQMIRESEKYSNQVLWFSSLVSKQSHLNGIMRILENSAVAQFKTIPLGTSNKSSRIVIWSFFTKEEQHAWGSNRMS